MSTQCTGLVLLPPVEHLPETEPEYVRCDNAAIIGADKCADHATRAELLRSVDLEAERLDPGHLGRVAREPS